MLTFIPLTRLLEAKTPAVAPPAAASKGAAALALLLGAAALGGCVDQPKPGCISTTNAFAVKLITLDGPVESAPGACTGFGPETFNALPEIGLAPFFAQGSDFQPDYGRGSLAVQTAELGTYFFTAQDYGVGNAVDGTVYSFGSFTSGEPDGDNFCYVPELSPTRVVLPEVPAVVDDPATEDSDESFPGQPPVDATLEWSNIRVYVTADTFGTQMEGEFVDTRINPAGESCVYTYRALGLAPAVSCQATGESGAPAFNEDGTPVLAPELCDPEADPANGRPLGSGISPNARFECDRVTAFCLPEGDTIPALR